MQYSYIPHDTLIVLCRHEDAAKALFLREVLWVGPLLARHKLSPLLIDDDNGVRALRILLHGVLLDGRARIFFGYLGAC